MTTTPPVYFTHTRPRETEPGRVDAELAFPVASRVRAGAHHSAAVTLAQVHGLDWHTPFKLNPNWTPYRELTEGIRFGQQDERRLTVWGPARRVATFLTALQRTLAQVEAAATRAARALGTWLRSARAEEFLQYEDSSTLRYRARDFRIWVLWHLVAALAGPAPQAPDRLEGRPLWEQSATVAGEVHASAGIDLSFVDEDAVVAILARVRRLEAPAPQPQEPQVPDTVQELLHLAGPVARAPREAAAVPSRAGADRSGEHAGRIGSSHGWRGRAVARRAPRPQVVPQATGAATRSGR
ncbi:hypothetical protein [Streptacidiphilus sp. EB103A]|uniref:hypothetical protein n=1 Tax=Streptacidiphilus sp. EB103A TaxID=3156275 RepID=UPI0035141387